MKRNRHRTLKKCNKNSTDQKNILVLENVFEARIKKKVRFRFQMNSAWDFSNLLDNRSI